MYSDGRTGDDLIQMFLHVFQFFHVADRSVASVHDERMIKMHREQNERYQHRYDDDGGGDRRRERIIPEFHPAEYRHFNQEQEQT